MHVARTLAALLAGAALLTACGPPTMDDYATSLSEDALAGGLGLTEAEADCYGQEAAQGLGIERLAELDDVEQDAPNALTEADADVMAGALVSCVDGVVERLFSNIGRQISGEGQACLAANLTEADVAAAAAATLREGDLPSTTRDRFDAAFVTCAGVEVVALGAPGLALALQQDGLSVDEGQARCALEHLVDDLGIEALTNANGASLDLAGTRSLLVGLRGCTDDLLDQIREQVLTDVEDAAGDDFGPDQRACLAEALDGDLLFEVFAFRLVGEQAAAGVTDALEARIAACA